MNYLPNLSLFGERKRERGQGEGGREEERERERERERFLPHSPRIPSHPSPEVLDQLRPVPLYKK